MQYFFSELTSREVLQLVITSRNLLKDTKAIQKPVIDRLFLQTDRYYCFGFFQFKTERADSVLSVFFDEFQY